MNRPRPAVPAAALMLVAGVGYLVVEFLVARAWTNPPYDWVQDLVPDLGSTGCGPIRGHLVCSPLHELMNGGFIAHGVVFGLAVILWARQLHGGPRVLMTAVGLTHAVGLGLLGLFPRSPDAPTVDLILNYVGSGLAVLAPTAVIVIAGRYWSSLGLPRGFGRAGVVLGVALLVVGVVLAVVPVLPPGLTERISIETVMAWQIVTGLVLLVRGPASHDGLVVGHRRGPSTRAAPARHHRSRRPPVTPLGHARPP